MLGFAVLALAAHADQAAGSKGMDISNMKMVVPAIFSAEPDCQYQSQVFIEKAVVQWLPKPRINVSTSSRNAALTESGSGVSNTLHACTEFQCSDLGPIHAIFVSKWQ